MKTLSAEQALAGPIRRHSLADPGSSIDRIAADLVGLHNTTQVSPYLSLRARLEVFSREDLEALMWEEWRLARFRAMRLTMFIFPTELLEIAAAATRHIARRSAERWLRDAGLSHAEFDRLATRVHEALADGPLTAIALRRQLDVSTQIDLPGVIGRMCDGGRLAGGKPPRNWRSSVRGYHRWDDVLPKVDIRRWDEERAIRELIRRYVRSYGPVTRDDVSWWTGLTKARCRRALEGLETEEVAVEGWPGPLYRIAGEDTSTDAESSVKALPLLDPYVQGYRDRARFLDPARHVFVYDGGGNATATLVERGRIIGVWQMVAKPKPAVRYHLFARGPESTRKAAEADLADAGTLYFDQPVDVIEIPGMKPLNADGGRNAAHPLDNRLHRVSRRPQAAPRE